MSQSPSDDCDYDGYWDSVAEERAAYRRGDYATDQDADEAADRYYDRREP